ncbi:MAG: replicative DNA helicase [Spirochaetes bacterium]|nr:replicative DNA helicase [Spirochaetota bacterium]
MNERIPPQDIDTEVACLASALLSREALYKVTEILQPEDFYIERHRLIYNAILDLERKNRPLDLTTLKQRLVDLDQLEKIGGDVQLVEMYRAVSTSANAEHYARRIKEMSLRRRLIEVSADVIDRCYDRSAETEEVLDHAEREIFQVTDRRITSDFKKIDAVIRETMDNIGTWYETKKVVTGISSGFKDIDEILTGFHEAELIIIASRPGMGKTAFALNIMNHIAIREKKPALFFSLEMPATQLALRMLCVESMVDSQRVRTGHISGEEMTKLLQVSSKIETTPMFIDDTPSVNVMQLRAKARRMAQKHPLGVIIVDYLQLVSGNQRIERHLQIAEISRFLKELARELSVPVIALSQLSRAVEQRTDQRPTLADLRESGAIEQDADVVMFLYREEKVKRDPDESKKGLAEIMIAKQRNGPVGNVTLRFWEKYTKFGDFTPAYTYEETSQVNELQ